MFDKDEKYRSRRELMVENQIKFRGIKNKAVLDALLKVERHLFVPEKLRREAYKDHPVPIGHEQTISQPYIVAYMTEKLEVQKHHRVLEVGTGCGYQTAILCELAKEVFTIELVKDLALKAGRRLQELNYTNFRLKIDDAYLGWKEHAPFDRIMVTCAPSKLPVDLASQLTDNGKMIVPYGQSYAQELFLIEKQDDTVHQKRLLPVRFVPMKNKFGKKH